MDDESPLGMHLRRGVALLIGAGVGLLLVYLLVAITAGARRGEPIAVDDGNLAPSAMATSYAVAAMPAAATGEELFAQRCAHCHGVKGQGDGLLAGHLTTQPRDLVKGPYWLRSTPAGSGPTRDDVKKVVERGIPGTMMPGFEGGLRLANAERSGIDLVVDHLIARSAYLQKPGTAVELEEQAAGEDWEVEAGKAVWDALKCAECHGDDGRGGGPRAAALKDGRGQAVRVPDLSAPWDFRRGAETHHIWMALELGLSPQHMPELTGKTSKGDRLAVAAFVRSLSRKLLDTEDMKTAREKRGLLRHGEDMVHLLACGRCHTPTDPNGLPRRDLAFAGGVEIRTPQGVFHAGNLTPHPEHGIGKASDGDLTRAIVEGVAFDGHAMDPLAHPWTWYSKLASSDLAAIVAYLRSLPPTANAVDDAQRESRGVLSMLGVMLGSGQPAVERVSRVAAVGAAPATGSDDDGATGPVADKPTGGAAGDKPAAGTTAAGVPDGDKPGEGATAAATPATTDVAEDGEDDADEVPQSPETRLAVARTRVQEANQRLSDAAAAYALAKAEYEKVKAELGSDDDKADKGKKKKKKKRKKRQD